MKRKLIKDYLSLGKIESNDTLVKAAELIKKMSLAEIIELVDKEKRPQIFEILIFEGSILYLVKNPAYEKIGVLIWGAPLRTVDYSLSIQINQFNIPFIVFNPEDLEGNIIRILVNNLINLCKRELIEEVYLYAHAGIFKYCDSHNLGIKFCSMYQFPSYRRVNNNCFVMDPIKSPVLFPFR